MNRKKTGTASEHDLIGPIFPGYVFTYAVSSLAGCISSLIDSLVVSNMLGEVSMAVIGLTGVYYTILTLLGGFFSLGTQILCSRALSRGDRERSSHWFSLAIETSLCVTGILALLLILFSGEIAVVLGAPRENTELIAQVSAFNRGFFVNLPLSILIMILTMAANLSGNKKLVTVSVILTVVTDAVLDVLAAGVLNMGIFGIALATTVANAVTVLYLILGLKKKGSGFRFSPVRFSFGEIGQITRHGLPNVVYKVMVILRTLLLNNLVMSTGGTTGMGILSVLNSLSHLLMIMGTGTAGTTCLMSSVFYGEKDVKALKQVGKYTVLYALAGGGCIALLTILLAAPLASCFTDPAGPMYGGLITALRIYAFSIPLTAFSESMFRYAQGVGKSACARRMAIVCQLAMALVMLLLHQLIGLAGIWASFPVGMAFSILAMIPVCFYEVRNPDTGFTEKILLLDKGILTDNADGVEGFVRNDSDISLLSEEVRQFCAGHGEDRKRSYFSALCMEELGQLTLQHANAEKKTPYCHIRVYYEKNDLILRIRDNSTVFDLTERVYREKKEDDPCANIGIRMVYSIAKEVRYVRLLNTNTLIITL